uniref:Two-component response regulator ARR10-like n=1 Tax=Cicer arietinum TaxID=3827 RepID=A0A3Q7YBY2_CICAR|nr:two-component response regulator ARR10-like [Cicer arietinum]
MPKTMQSNYWKPITIMSSHYSTNSVMEAITKGASDYWIKPLEEQHFQTMWKHVVKGLIINENQNMNDIFHMNNKRGKEQVDVPKQTIDENHNHNDDYPSPAKKFRWSWTQQLHNQFVTVVNELGLENAKPKKILKIMGVPGLTRENIASHLHVRFFFPEFIKWITHIGLEMEDAGAAEIGDIIV